MGTLRADRPEKQPSEATVTARADHQHVGGTPFFDEDLGRLPLADDRVCLHSCIGSTLDRFVSGLSGEYLEGLTAESWDITGAAIDGRRDVPRCDEAKTCASEAGLVDRPLERLIAVIRAIHTDDDRLCLVLHELLSQTVTVEEKGLISESLP